MKKMKIEKVLRIEAPTSKKENVEPKRIMYQLTFNLKRTEFEKGNRISHFKSSNKRSLFTTPVIALGGESSLVTVAISQ